MKNFLIFASHTLAKVLQSAIVRFLRKDGQTSDGYLHASAVQLARLISDANIRNNYEIDVNLV
jgi:hypothetical protein